MCENAVVLGYLCSRAGTMQSGATQPGEAQESQTGQMARKTDMNIGFRQESRHTAFWERRGVKKELEK